MMADYSYDLKVPKERIAVLIGSKGETKTQLEEAAHIKLVIDSQEGDVTIEGEDPLALYVAKDIIRAIARGFNPHIAMFLLKQDYMFELVDITNYATTQAAALRLKGRVIGKDGKARATIELLTDTHISVYGKTIAIIGSCDTVAIARRAVDNLLK